MPHSIEFLQAKSACENNSQVRDAPLLLQRYLFMKLSYTEDTPEDYEPPYFQAEGDRQPAYFTHKPFSMCPLCTL